MTESSSVTPEWINIGQPYNDPIHRRTSQMPPTQACSLMLHRPDPAPKNRTNLPWVPAQGGCVLQGFFNIHNEIPAGLDILSAL